MNVAHALHEALGQTTGPIPWLWILLLVAGVAVLVMVLVVGQFFTLWLQAFMAGFNVTMWSLIGMRLRKVDSRQIVLSKISAIQAGLNLTTEQLESHYLSGGRVPNVVRPHDRSASRRIDLPWDQAARDRSGRPRCARCGADFRESQSDRRAQCSGGPPDHRRRGQGRHSA